MPMIRGIPDHHLPGPVDGDEIAALDGDDPLRGSPGDDMLFDIFGRNFPSSESGPCYQPVDRGIFRGRGRDVIQDFSRTAGDFVDVL
jgi:hypothetical protein